METKVLLAIVMTTLALHCLYSSFIKRSTSCTCY